METLTPFQIEAIKLPEGPIFLVANFIQLMRSLGIQEIDIQAQFSDPAF